MDTIGIPLVIITDDTPTPELHQHMRTLAKQAARLPECERRTKLHRMIGMMPGHGG